MVWKFLPFLLISFLPFSVFCKTLSPETSNFLDYLSVLSSNNRCLFGRQNEYLAGLNNDGSSWGFYFQSNNIDISKINCDIRRISHHEPSLINIDIATVALNYNNKVELNNLRNLIISYYKKTRGAVSINCHLANPYWKAGQTKVDAYRYLETNKNAVYDILNNKKIRQWYNKKLMTIINFFNSLKDDNNILIPVIFRPFHEASTNSFWWGSDRCSDKEFIKLYRYTFQFIRKYCSNVLFAYSPDKNWNTLEVDDRYMSRYPGDEYVDILGLDCYGLENEQAVNKCIQQLRLLSFYSKVHHKVVALTETGNMGCTVHGWYSNNLMKVLTADGVDVAYVVVWSSWSKSAFLSPLMKTLKHLWILENLLIQKI